MKKNISNLILFAVAIFSGCQPKTPKTSDNSVGNDSNAKIESTYLCSPTSRASDPAHLITYEKAIDYVWDFHSNLKTLNEIGWTEIPVDFMSFKSTHCGLVTYFCYDDTTKGYYLAYKFNPSLDENVDPFPVDENEDYYKSECSGNFNSKSLTSRDLISDSIKKINYLCDFHSSNPIKGSQVNTDGNLFLDKIKNASGSLPDILKFTVGFFHDTQLKEIIGQDCKGLRIYWGYIDSTSNRIKIIAFAIDKDGKNITTDNKILEKSWPPF